MKMNWKGFGRKLSWLKPGTILPSVIVMMIIYLFIFFCQVGYHRVHF
jgi:hypothetical protein